MTPWAHGSAPPHRRRLLHLFMIAAVIVSIWALVGLYNASEFYRTSRAIGGSADWSGTLGVYMLMSLNWALWTPVIVAIAERLPLDASHRLRSIRSLALLTILIPILATARA